MTDNGSTITEPPTEAQDAKALVPTWDQLDRGARGLAWQMLRSVEASTTWEEIDCTIVGMVAEMVRENGVAQARREAFNRGDLAPRSD